jgi:hypothetical protein
MKGGNAVELLDEGAACQPAAVPHRHGGLNRAHHLSRCALKLTGKYPAGKGTNWGEIVSFD